MPDKNLDELSNKDLQAELVTLGMPEEDAAKVTTKSVLIAMINTLKAKEVSEKIDPTNVPADPGEEKRIDGSWRAKTKKQWNHWNNAPKIKIMVPLSAKEKQGVIRWVFDKGLDTEIPIHVSGAIQPVTENGAQYLIPKGVYIDVPEPVAKIIQDKFQQTSDAGKDILADRIDPETGKPVSEQL